MSMMILEEQSRADIRYYCYYCIDWILIVLYTYSIIHN